MKVPLPFLMLLTLLSSPSLFAQTQESTKEFEARWEKANMERYIPKGFTRADSENKVKLLPDLERLIVKLDGTTPENSRVVDSSGDDARPRRAFGRIIDVDLSENAESKTSRQLHMKIWSYDSLKHAEEGLAHNAASVSLVKKAGPITGREIGELSYHAAKPNESTVMFFLRRNVVVSVYCGQPIRVSKDRTTLLETLNDPELMNKCEDLAKKIDDFIIGLTAK